MRHDSGMTREFEEVGEDLQQNSVLHALFLFQAFMVHGVEHKHRPKLDYDINTWICTLFNLHTVTQRDILGEPALEGVHSDGVDATMTTLLGRTNMTEDSAVTFLHTPDEVNGTRWNAINQSISSAKSSTRTSSTPSSFLTTSANIASRQYGLLTSRSLTCVTCSSFSLASLPSRDSRRTLMIR